MRGYSACLTGMSDFCDGQQGFFVPLKCLEDTVVPVLKQFHTMKGSPNTLDGNGARTYSLSS